MSTQEIPRTQWHTFFDAFSRQHGGWLASLEVFANTLGAQPEAEELPLEGISLDAPDADSEAIVITLGDTPDAHVTHTIHQPTHLWLQRTPEGADGSIEIQAEDDSSTLLRFRSPTLPDFVDGIV